jgi:hypothetical protein
MLLPKLVVTVSVVSHLHLLVSSFSLKTSSKVADPSNWLLPKRVLVQVVRGKKADDLEDDDAVIVEEEEDPSVVLTEWPSTRPLQRFRIEPTYDKDDPDTWDRDTPSFAVMCYFGNGSVELNTFQEALKKHSIQTLEQLQRKKGDLEPHLFGNTLLMEETMDAAMRRVSENPEYILGGLLFYDEICVCSDSFHLYTPDAVSIDSDRHSFKSSCESLVSGPIGSGKTAFALSSRLVERIFGERKGQTVFRIHFRVQDLVALMRSSKLGLGDAVVSVVQKQIDSELTLFKVEPVETLKLRLQVIIDDAGGDLYHEYFNGQGKIGGIVSCLQSMKTYKFDQVHVTLVGTSLEARSYHFHMTPLSQSNFQALVDASYKPNREVVKEVVAGSPILKQLSCNARCAVYLLELIHRVTLVTTDKGKLNAMTGQFIADVASSFISTCGLGKLENESEKWFVIGSVARMLDKASTRRHVAFFPRFTALKSARLRSIALGLLDVRTETEVWRGHPTLCNYFYCSAVTNLALMIVMVELLNQETPVSWDSFSVELVLMLEEWKRMVAQWHERSSKANPSMLQLDYPFPTTSGAKLEFRLPLVTDTLVVQNKPSALYADVVAPYRLVRAKFSKDESMELDLEKDLAEMGLLMASGNVMQQAASSILHTMWEGQKDVVSSKIVPDGNNQCRQSKDASNAVVCRLGNQDGLVTFGKKDDPLVLHQTIPILKNFGEKSPVAAVFVTNCERFVLKQKGAADVIVERHAVDRAGRLKRQTFPTIANLRENVAIRLLFTSIEISLDL